MANACTPSKHIFSKIVAANTCYCSNVLSGFEDILLFTPDGDEFQISPSSVATLPAKPFRVQKWLLLDLKKENILEGTLVEMSWKKDLTPAIDSLKP